MPNCRQLLNNRHHRGRSWIGGGTHRSDVVRAGLWEWRQQVCARSARRWRLASDVWPAQGDSVSLSRFELLEVNAQGFDFRFERLPRQTQLGRRAGWA